MENDETLAMGFREQLKQTGGSSEQEPWWPLLEFMAMGALCYKNYTLENGHRVFGKCKILACSSTYQHRNTAMYWLNNNSIYGDGGDVQWELESFAGVPAVFCRQGCG